MQRNESEEKLLHSAALKTANTVLLARRRAEQELLEAKQELEHKTKELAHLSPRRGPRSSQPPTAFWSRITMAK